MLRSPAAMLPSRHLPHNPASSRQARRVDPLQVSCILCWLVLHGVFLLSQEARSLVLVYD